MMNCQCGGCAWSRMSNNLQHRERYFFLAGGGQWFKREPGWQIAVIIVMKHDPFDAAIDEILESADGDVRRALRAVLEENVQLEFELRNLYAESEHGERADKKSLH
jgi:hypothetical protein